MFNERMKGFIIANGLKVNYRAIHVIIRKHKAQNTKAKRGRKHIFSTFSLRRMRRQIEYDLFEHLSV